MQACTVQVSDGSTVKTCMAACRDQTYFVSESTALYPSSEVFKYRPSFCYIVRKLARTCSQEARKKSLEINYPGVCRQVRTVIQNEACEQLYDRDKIRSWTSSSKFNFENTIFKYTKENVALVTVFLDKPYCVKIIQEIKFNLISLIGNIGGVLGLCLGGSLISLVEVVWFCLSSWAGAASRRCDCECSCNDSGMGSIMIQAPSQEQRDSAEMDPIKKN